LCLDYITEKFWDTLAAGVIPVYWGAPNIADRAPHPHSFINVQDFKVTKDLVTYLQKVMTDRALYNSYHEWRKQPLSQSFVDAYGFTRAHDSCRMCQWAFAKRYGYKWTHASQAVEELTMSRDLSIGVTGMIAKPFIERVNKLQSTTECSAKQSKDPYVAVIGDAVRRSIKMVDNFIDIRFDPIMSQQQSTEMYAELETLLVGETRWYKQTIRSELRQGTMYMLQNHTSRYTFLIDPDTRIARNEKSVRFSLDRLPLRLRVVIEEVDRFHLKAYKYANYFGQLMAEDFYNPIEAFAVA
jgi:Glycosyltransferase family 10 (fucosyltransferase) C-term